MLMKLLAAYASFSLLFGCESKRPHLREPAIPLARPNTRFAGIDTTLYSVDSVSIRYGCYLVVRETEEQFVAVFYRPAPDNSWQK